jgi:hypothetical protein
MIANRPSRFIPSAPVVADLLCVATAAFPTWAMFVSSAYLMLVCGAQALDIRRLWNW